MSFTTGQLQQLQALNRQVIKEIQDDIVFYKANKTLNDEAGHLTAEYVFHDQLQHARRELKKWVALQMSCKAQLRHAYGFERYCNSPSTDNM